jgi:tetratricopeptide (TPR) repeat protein
MPAALPVIALVVLLVNLLAAGATSFPGVFVAAWVLLPVALADSQAPVWNWQLPRLAVFGILGVALAMLTTCVRTKLAPVLSENARVAAADEFIQQGQLPAADAELIAAARADRWSPEAWRRLADLRLQVYLQTGRAMDYESFSQAMLIFRRKNPRHHRQFEACGNWLLLAWRKSGEPMRLAAAVDSYSQAASAYPSRALGQAQLAWALHLAGQTESAAKAAAEALRLDALNPHAEQKLNAQFVYDPLISPTGITSYRPENAEQTMLGLRRSASPKDVP